MTAAEIRPGTKENAWEMKLTNAKGRMTRLIVYYIDAFKEREALRRRVRAYLLVDED